MAKSGRGRGRNDRLTLSSYIGKTGLDLERRGVGANESRSLVVGGVGSEAAELGGGYVALPNPILNWDPSDNSGLTMVGSKVSVLADLSGNGLNLSQGTDAKRPSLGTLGNRQALSFDGISNGQTMGGASWTLQALTVYSAHQSSFTSAPAHGSNAGTYNLGGDGPILFQGWVNGNGGNLSVYGGADLLADVGNDAGVYVTCLVFAGASSELYVNGVLKDSGDLPAALVSRNLELGSYYDSQSWFGGLIGQTIAYAGVHTAAERAQMLAYMNFKWHA